MSLEQCKVCPVKDSVSVAKNTLEYELIAILTDKVCKPCLDKMLKAVKKYEEEKDDWDDPRLLGC
jgi:hypothetical protein